MYVEHSTANPLGRRPWESRLGAYQRGTFVIPTQTPGQSAACAGCPASGLACGGCPQMASLGATFPNLAYPGHTRVVRLRDRPESPLPRIVAPPEFAGRPQMPIRTAGVVIRGRDLRTGARPQRTIMALPRPPITATRAPATVAVAAPAKTAAERRAEFWALRRPTGEILPAAFRPAPGPARLVPGTVARNVTQRIVPPYLLGQVPTAGGITEWMQQESLIGGVKNWWIAAGVAGLLILRRRRG